MCGASMFGVKMWALKVFYNEGRAKEDGLVLDFDGSRNGYMFMPITNHRDWQVAKVQALGRHEIAKAYPNVNRPPGIGLVKVASSVNDLLVVAARDAFKQMLVPHLKLLWSYLGVPGSMHRTATTEALLVSGLVRHVLPGLLPSEYEEILARRSAGHAVECAWSSLLTAENVELLQDTMDTEHVQELMTEIKKTTKKKSATSTGSTAAPSSSARAATSASSGAAPSSSTAAPAADEQRPVDPERQPSRFRGSPHIDVEEARQYTPCVQGCNLHLEELWHTRWKCTYPRAEPPRLVSKSFAPGSGCSSGDALLHVLRTVWAWHSDATGQPCPYDL